MRFDYGEKNADRLAIATDIASMDLELDSHCLVLNERLWRVHDDQQPDRMAILATRFGILNTASAAYVMRHDETFREAAAHLISRGKDLVNLAQQPCVPGVELCLSILLGNAAVATDIATAMLSLPVSLARHPEDAKSLLIAALVAGSVKSTNVLLSELQAFEGLTKSEQDGWRLWRAVISERGIEQDALRALIKHEDRLVRTELSKLAREKESDLSAFDLVCFSLEALKLLSYGGVQPSLSST